MKKTKMKMNEIGDGGWLEAGGLVEEMTVAEEVVFQQQALQGLELEPDVERRFLSQHPPPLSPPFSPPPPPPAPSLALLSHSELLPQPPTRISAPSPCATAALSCGWG